MHLPLSARARHWILTVGLSMLLSLSLSRAETVTAGSDARDDSLGTHWTGAMDELHLPGLIVVVVNRDGIVRSDLLGVRDVDRHLPLDPDTRVYIASCTKPFVACAAAVLAAEGKLDLDAPVREYLPRFTLADADYVDSVTVRSLLCHRPGLANSGITRGDAYTGEMTEDRYYRMLGETRRPAGLPTSARDPSAIPCYTAISSRAARGDPKGFMKQKTSKSSIRRIAFIGNYLPRQCGIATFTTDLCEAIAKEYPGTACLALPVNDNTEGYAYPARVRFELTEKEVDSYMRAANFLNINNVDLVCLQHEYGIFGGKAGAHILALLRELRMPVVTTLHTILQEPNDEQRAVLEELASLSNRVISMSERGVTFLREIYKVPAEKIDLIPHGIPDVPFVDPSFHKDLFGVEGKMVLLSFGLLSTNKGIENVINALPRILEKYPNVVYIVVGATHPHILQREGEAYRNSLEWLAQEKGVAGNVIFYNRFVSLDELIKFISATDIYITPYLSPQQITSGTLAYTVGAGKAVISTPYWYAEELLADGRGVLVPFRDADAIAEHTIELLDDESKRDAMRKRAYLFGREMIWPTVANRYMAAFERARTERRYFTPPAFAVKPLDQRPGEHPPIRLDHLRHMTDETGMLQHAVFTTPNYREGYTTDDNARALLVSTLLEALGSEQALDLAHRYLAFVWFSFNPDTSRFRNFMDYQRNWLEDSGSDDSHGRVLWALGTVLGRSNTPALQNMAGRVFETALNAIRHTTSPRAWAFALLGIHEYLQRFDGDRRAGKVREELCGRLLALYNLNRADDWHWYESNLTYCNAAIPHAMIVCGESMSNQGMLNTGLESLEWLAKVQRADAPGHHFVPIGTNGFYSRGGERARFDQQPVEAQAMVSACLEAYRITDDARWRKEARRAFDWFLGRNDLHVPIYDPTTGGCRDGLHPDRANANQGAESTLAFLQALLELRLSENAHANVEARTTQ